MKKIKFVKRANAWCVTTTELDPKTNQRKQTIEWFDTHAQALVSMESVVN